MTEPVRILVIDDDAGIRFFAEETLRRSGHTVVTVPTGELALDALRDTAFAVVIVDLRLGGGIDGLRVLEALRWRWPETAVVILTGHGTLESAQDAIRKGVDRYLLKPIEAETLREAVEGALRQKQVLVERVLESADDAPGQASMESGPFFIDLKKHVVQLHGEPLDLTTREFDLLVYLIQNAHRVVPPPELVEVVRHYRPDTLQEAREVIKWYIYQLRKKVEVDSSNPRYILNVRGVGYRYGG